MNSNAQPADMRASFTLGTVKKRVMTCGNPAVPTISASVIKMTSMRGRLPWVYLSKPRSVLSVLSFCSSVVPSGEPPRYSGFNSAPKPSCGTTWPVIISEMKIAGTRYAKISTQYCATCV